jgi:hypothetical protein
MFVFIECESLRDDGELAVEAFLFYAGGVRNLRGTSW